MALAVEIIHGPNGSYKSSSLFEPIKRALEDNRTIVTNLRGLVDIDELNRVFNFKQPSTSKIITIPFNTKGYEQMAHWFHWVPLGSLVLIDEASSVYPTRLRKLDCFDVPSDHVFQDDPDRPRTMEDAFDRHRHFNWDLYLTTTSISKVHKEVRQMAEAAYRHKNLASQFKFLRGFYKRVKHDPENSGKLPSHAITTSLKKVDKTVFSLYQSTSTGETSDVQTGTNLFTNPKFLLLSLVIFSAAIYFMDSLSAYRATTERPQQVASAPQKNSNPQVLKTADAQSIRDAAYHDRYGKRLSASVVELLDSVLYHHTTIRKHGFEYELVHYFQTEKATISSKVFDELGVVIKTIDDWFLLDYNGHVVIVPTGAPPEFESPEEFANQLDYPLPAGS